MPDKHYYTRENPGIYEAFHHPDIAVIGGGMAETACAVTAARLSTLLLQNQHCLGGPAGAECDSGAIGQLICGAVDWVNRDARETGVIEDMRLDGEDRYEKDYRAYWSQMLRDLCEQQENFTLQLNTEAYDVTVAESKITGLAARTLGSDMTHHIATDIVVDCTGDSFPAFKAGADFRMGREARHECHETLAPEHCDTCTLGSSLFFRAVDTGRPVTFVPPPWAHEIHDESLFINRPHKDVSQGYWWLECGGDMNTIRDNEDIYHELLAILYGLWDHIKNHGDHGAESYANNWIAGVPGKRESRRIMGDYMLTEGDIVSNRTFRDGVAYGGGNVDLHPIKGFFSGNTPCGPEHGIMSPGMYQIPLRYLYSRNVENRLMAGRNISAAHVALSSTRLMATRAACGQAVVETAFRMRKYGITPRETGLSHAEELRTLLYRVDHTLPGVKLSDPRNLCGDATAQVSSSMPLDLRQCHASECLQGSEDGPSAQSFLSSEERLDSAFFRFDSPTRHPIPLRAWLVEQDRMYDFTTGRIIAEATGLVRPGRQVEAAFPLQADLVREQRYYIRFDAVPELAICSQHTCLHGVYKARMKRNSWPPKGDNMNLCCHFPPEQRPFQGDNLLTTDNRGGNAFSVWISEPRQGLPQTADIRFPATRVCACAELVFDTNLEALNITACQEECGRDYRLEGLSRGQWVPLAQSEQSHRRFCRHVFHAQPPDGLRLTILGTHGSPMARTYQIRAYENAEY